MVLFCQQRRDFRFIRRRSAWGMKELERRLFIQWCIQKRMGKNCYIYWGGQNPKQVYGSTVEWCDTSLQDSLTL